MRLHRVEEGIHQGWDTSIPGLWGWRSIHLNHGLEQEEQCGRVLFQGQNGQERFLGCWGMKCNKYERNYPSYKGEL